MNEVLDVGMEEVFCSETEDVSNQLLVGSLEDDMEAATLSAVATHVSLIDRFSLLLRMNSNGPDLATTCNFENFLLPTN